MTDVQRCNACGAELTEHSSPQGLCPSCLLKLGLSSPSAGAGPHVPDAQAVSVPAVETAPKRNRTVLSRRARWAGLAAASGFLALLIYLFVTHVARPLQNNQVLRFNIYPPNEAAFTPSATGNFALSPDSQKLVFVATHGEGKRLLWIHPLDSIVDQPLPGTDGAAFPFWSPDSQFIGFFAQGKLKRIHVSGGGPQSLCDVPSGRGGSWNADSTIVFAAASGPLFRVPAVGGTPAPLTTLDPSRREIAHQWPQFLPDSRHVLFSIVTMNSQNDGIYVADLDSGERKRVLADRSPAVFVSPIASPEHLLFLRNGFLMTQPFDKARMEVRNEAHPIRFAEQIETASFAASAGVLAYRTGNDRTAELIWQDRSGKFIGTVSEAGEFRGFSLAPDGRFVAVSRRDPETKTSDLWVKELARDVASRFTFDAANDAWPVWSPDGSRIVFLSNRSSAPGIYQKMANGAGSEELLLMAPNLRTIDSWSPDGRFLFYTAHNEKGISGVWALPLSGDKKPVPVATSAFDQEQGRLSPDGRWLAYVSNESGKNEIFVQAFPEHGGRWQISTAGGSNPNWRRDGRELFYVSPEGMLMAVPVVAAANVIVPGQPAALFKMAGEFYTVTPDGRFLVEAAREEPQATPIHIVVNWATENRQAP